MKPNHHVTRPAGASGKLQRWVQAHSRQDFAERFFQDRHGQPWMVRDYQRESLESGHPRKVHCDGRDVGKSMEIEILACWAILARPDSEMLIATQCESHLFPIMHRIARRIDAIPELSGLLEQCRRSPGWYLRFSTGFVLWGRIAGPRGVNFQGLHVDWQIVDEAQEMRESSWGELYQALNGGGFRWVYGVPNGLRNTFYRMTRMPGLDQHHWPSTKNPDYTAAKDEELAQLYGGRRSPGYIHRVLGEHGAPAHAVFALEDYLACVNPDLICADLTLHEGDPLELPRDAPPGEYYLGCDLGYARDPSEFVVYESRPPYLVNVLRMRLEGVNYLRQQDIVQQLDAVYAFRGIGLDAGNAGRALAHALFGNGADWVEKVHTYEFGGTLDLTDPELGYAVRRRTKEFMTELLQRRMDTRTIMFPALPDRENQYAAHTYQVGPTGQIVYEKGNDHLIDGDRCALLRHFLETEEPPATCEYGLGIEVWD